MKKIITIISIYTFALFINTSCIKEDFPTTVLTIDQIKESEESVQGLLNGALAYLHQNYYNSLDVATGYPMMMMFRDVATHDYPPSSTYFDYFNFPFGATSGLGHTAYSQTIWMYNYSHILNIHSVISATNGADATPIMKNYLGVAYSLRAMVYFDMARSFEYQPTGVAALDAVGNNVLGLTVPIVTENTTENEARNNPRAPFYRMYRFILTDLNNAETLIADYQRPLKNHTDLSVVYGFKARFWLEIATRFEKTPADLATFLEHENDADLQNLAKLGVTTAKECYKNAADYARKAIDESGCTPLTQEQWYDKTKGFNNVNSQDSWMFAIMIGPDALGTSTFINWVSYTSAETEFGINNMKYSTVRTIGKELYDKIPDSDWRKLTWIAPDDAGKESAYPKYNTLLSSANWIKYPKLSAFKFRPGEGNMTNHKVGAAVDIPLMRVEEMYLIEAEALAQTQGLGAGISKLESFVNTYRYTDGSYSCNPIDMDDFVQKVVEQKRIELWGEGLVYFDYKRLKMRVLRGYPDTNYPVGQRFNSIPGYIAPWMNYYITDNELTRNLGIEPNPDPSKSIEEWK